MSTFQKYRVQGIVLGLLMPSLVVAALELPHTFKSGEVISASEMNENFEALREKIEALEASQKELEEEVAALRANAPAAVDLSLTKTAEDCRRGDLRVAPERSNDWNVASCGQWQCAAGALARSLPDLR
jgi:cell division protein FtsB